MKMTHHNYLNIGDLTRPSGSDSLRKSVYCFVPISWATFQRFRSTACDNIFAGACVKKNEAYVWVIDQSCNHDQLPTLMRLWWKPDGELIGSGEDICCIQVNSPQV